MEYCIFPMRTINITQRALDSYSHKNLEAWDIAGKDTGIEPAYAPCRVKVLAKLPYETTGFANTVFFGSCDEAGNQCKVRTENGQERVLTFALTHDNNISDISVGHIYQSGEKIYDEGTKGKATGNHIHMEVAEGWQYKKVKRSDGVWVAPNLVHIADVFLQLQGWTEIKNLNGYKMQTVATRKVRELFGLDYSGNANGVANVPNGTQHYDNEPVEVSRDIPTRQGYTFRNWNSQPDGSGYIYNPGDMFDHNWYTCLWAQWQPIETYNIYYEPNGDGVSNLPENQTKQTDETVHISSAVPTRNSYTFRYWCVHPDGNGTIYSPGDTYNGNWSSSLYAQWVKNATPVYGLEEAIRVFQDVAGKIKLTAEERKKYDIDGDGEITIVDAIKIFQKVAGKKNNAKYTATPT